MPVSESPQETSVSVVRDSERWPRELPAHITHDRFLPSDGVGRSDPAAFYSGRIVCRLTTEAPLIVGAKRKPHGNESARIDPFESAPGVPAIPASSLRGLISSLAEAASGSALRVLNDAYLTRRVLMRDEPPPLTALGILCKSKDAAGNDILKLQPLTLPAMPWDRRSRSAPVPTEWRKMFPDGSKQPLLKVYLDGYEPDDKKHPQLKPNSFLARRLPKSFSPDSKAFWYVKLRGNARVARGEVATTSPRFNDGGNGSYLVGQLAEGDPIPEAELPPEKRQGYTRGILRVLGIDGRESEIPDSKLHEVFIPYEHDSYPKFEVADAINRFHQLADQRTDEDEQLPFTVAGSCRNGERQKLKARVRLRDGDIVFFRPDRDNPKKVAEVSISGIWRRDVGTVHQYFRAAYGEEVLPFSPDRETLTLAEQMFGFVEDRSKLPREQRPKRTSALALSGRLHFSMGQYQRKAPDERPYEVEEPALLKVLASPKPPAPSLYFKHSGGQARGIKKPELKPAEPDGHLPQGRKFYLHHRQVDWRGPSTIKPTLRNYAQPVAACRDFYFHVDFRNLIRFELALLCFALRPDDSFRHKLGLGKSLGLGTVEIAPEGLFLTDRKQRYSQDDLWDGHRYHYGWILSPDAAGSWPAAYAAEKAGASDLLPDDQRPPALAAEFARQAGDVAKALRLIGNPGKVTQPVHTPQIAGSPLDERTYEWFVANEDRRDPQGLRPLTAANTNDFTTLPTLER